ncbi:MAG TPA: hypothetical protein VK081_02805 [Planctomycetota bacterium]|nr:hypothetical protein [Planctomycetota bacterium]
MAAALAAALPGQGDGQKALLEPSGWHVDVGYMETSGLPSGPGAGDVATWTFLRGVKLRRGGTEIFAGSGVLEHDVDAARTAMQRDDGPYPRRTVPAPDPRRVADQAELERRLGAFLAAAAHRPPPRADVRAPSGREAFLGIVRSMFLEGGVTVLHDGVEVLQADSLYLSALDDRMVVRGAVLRLPSRDPETGQTRMVTLRGERLVRQGPRITGRDVSVTTSIAGEPHFEFVAGEVEVIERGDELEVRGRDNRLLVHGVEITALPDIDFFTSQEPPIPLKGISGGYGSEEGFRTEVRLGGTWNRTGGALHEALTGDAAEEFRGQWRAAIGFNQDRGVPLEGELAYRGGTLYRGRTRAFVLDDQGRNRGPIQVDLDGGFITERDRRLLRSENRVFLGEHTALDLELFTASDPAVYPEFFQSEWMETELPETRAFLRHARDNWIATVSGRFELDGIAYRDDRTLAPRFLEERPLGTFDLFSEPLFEIANGVPLLLTTSASAGVLRFDYDRLAPSPADEEALRFDHEVELAAPFLVGPLHVRPFLFGRVTWYDDSPDGDDVARWSWGGGVRAGTRLSRTWRPATEGGRAVRHVVHPEVAFLHRAAVGRDPADVFQFDAVDALDEDVTVRVGLLNRVLTSVQGGDGTAEIEEPIWLDLAQNFKPIRDRDNDGELLGLTEYELILRPGLDWPVPNWRLFVEGEYDAPRHENRTFNVGTHFGPLAGVHWMVEYREDRTRDGVLLGAINTTLWHRWEAVAGTSYDLDRDDTLNYFASLARHDLDWTARIGIVYDNLRDETSFFIRFEPTLGGFIEPRERELDRGLRSWGGSLQGF